MKYRIIKTLQDAEEFGKFIENEKTINGVHMKLNRALKCKEFKKLNKED